MVLLGKEKTTSTSNMQKFGFDTHFGPVFCFGGQVLDKPSKEKWMIKV